MKIHQLLENEQDLPIIVSMLLKLQKQGTPVFYVAIRDGELVLCEVYFVDSTVQYFSPDAPSDIANSPYNTVKIKAPGYYSWQTDDIGTGRGDGQFGLSHLRQEQYYIKRLPSVQGRTDFVFGRREFVKRWELEQKNKQNR